MCGGSNELTESRFHTTRPNGLFECVATIRRVLRASAEKPFFLCRGGCWRWPHVFHASGSSRFPRFVGCCFLFVKGVTCGRSLF